jgi:hypothetical protein
MTEHEFFQDRIAEYLAGGLPELERSQFESHLAACPTCAADYTAARQLEKNMTQLFAPIAPPSDFEDRLISRLRFSAPRLRISSTVRRAAIAASVAMLLGGAGYVMNQQIENGTLPLWSQVRGPKVASDLKQIGMSLSMYTSDFGLVSPVNTPAEEASRDTSGKWQFGSGGNPNLNWSDFPKIQPNDLAQQSQTIRFGDGNVPFQKSPYSGVAKDMILAGKSVSSEPGLVENAGQQLAIGKSIPNNRSVQLGTSTETYNYYGAPAYRAPVPDLSYYKPATVAQAQPAQSLPGLATALSDDLKNTAKQSEPQAVAAVTPTDAPVAAPTAAPVVATNGTAGDATTPSDTESTVAPSTQPSQKIIRNGTMDFEVDSFDSAAATIHKVVAEEGGAVATVNSQKLANGKVQGTVTVRVAPDHLDTLVLKLRALGDLKSQNLTAQDVTKDYTDTASELRADRAMEERLLNIIKTSQGQVKDLLAAEKELATWREKIEKAEGEIRYYDNLVAMSTLTISLSERDIKTAAAATESENVDMGVEADDVETARNDAIKLIDDAKGRITESELKKLDAGQLAAKIVAEIKPDASGPAVDRLKQLGRVARLEVTRQQTTVPGATPDSTTKLEKGDTHVILSLYNVANIAPRQTTIVNLASDDVEQTYQAILSRINKTGGRIVTSNLNRQTDQQTGGTIQAEVKSADADTVVAAIKALGEVVRLNAVENPDTNNVTAAKRGISIELSSLAAMLPREMNYRAIACSDVAKSRQQMLDTLRPLKPRIVLSKLEDPGDGKLNGYLDFEIRRADVPTIEKALAAAGETYDRRVDTSADADNVTDAKVQFKLQFAQATALPPRQTDTLGVEVSDVDAASQSIQNDATSLGGRIVDSSSSKDANSQTARLVIEVPLSHAADVLGKTHQLGIVRTNQQSTNAQAPSGELGREHLELTLSSGQALVADDQGIFASLRHGFAISFAGLMWSLQLIVIGLCFVLPWVLLIWGVMRLMKRRKGTNAVTSVT